MKAAARAMMGSKMGIRRVCISITGEAFWVWCSKVTGYYITMKAKGKGEIITGSAPFLAYRGLEFRRHRCRKIKGSDIEDGPLYHDGELRPRLQGQNSLYAMCFPRGGADS
jgi:hypothetical protein